MRWRGYEDKRYCSALTLALALSPTFFCHSRMCSLIR